MKYTNHVVLGFLFLLSFERFLTVRALRARADEVFSYKPGAAWGGSGGVVHMQWGFLPYVPYEFLSLRSSVQKSLAALKFEYGIKTHGRTQTHAQQSKRKNGVQEHSGHLSAISAPASSMDKEDRGAF